MRVHSPEPCYWYDFHRIPCHLYSRAAALLGTESAWKQVPHTSGVSHHTPQANLQLLLGCSGRARKCLSPGAAETAALQRCRRWRGIHCNHLTEHQGHCGHCRHLEGNHLMSKKPVKPRWRMRLQIYYSVALRYKKRSSPLSRGCTQSLFITHTPYAPKISTQQCSCIWATGAL